MCPRTGPAGRTTRHAGATSISLKRLNKVRHVRIDVPTMAEGSTDFARNLAGENGGQYATMP